MDPPVNRWSAARYHARWATNGHIVDITTYDHWQTSPHTTSTPSSPSYICHRRRKFPFPLARQHPRRGSPEFTGQSERIKLEPTVGRTQPPKKPSPLPTFAPLTTLPVERAPPLTVDNSPFNRGAIAGPSQGRRGAVAGLRFIAASAQRNITYIVPLLARNLGLGTLIW